MKIYINELFKKEASLASSSVIPNLDKTKEIFQKVPSWLLGATLGTAAGAYSDEEDRLRGALHGAGIGGIGGYLWDRAPITPKVSSITPSLGSGGTLGLSYSGGTERLPGTYKFVSKDVLERVGKSLDDGQSIEDTIASGAKSPLTRYLPIASTVAGGLLGRSISPTSHGAVLGGALGYGASKLLSGKLQSDIDEQAEQATKGLLIERANMGDQTAQQHLLNYLKK